MLKEIEMRVVKKEKFLRLRFVFHDGIFLRQKSALYLHLTFNLVGADQHSRRAFTNSSQFCCFTSLCNCIYVILDRICTFTGPSVGLGRPCWVCLHVCKQLHLQVPLNVV